MLPITTRLAAQHRAGQQAFSPHGDQAARVEKRRM
jgi:hypothetical protein